MTGSAFCVLVEHYNTFLTEANIIKLQTRLDAEMDEKIIQI